MTRRAKVFIAVVSVLGTAVGVGCVALYLPSLRGVPFEEYGVRLLVLTALCAVCRSYPIRIRHYQGIDLSVTPVMAAFLTDGGGAAVLVYAASTLFTFERAEDGSRHSMYDMPPVKTWFNLCNVMISIAVPCFLCKAFGWEQGQLSMPVSLLRGGVFSIASFAMNYVLFTTLFVLNNDATLYEMRKVASNMFMNVSLALPLGLLTAYTVVQPMGEWLTALMLGPLMLARHTWKLYVQAQYHKNEMIDAFVTAMEARDPYTQGHSKRVSEYAGQIAHRMNLSQRHIEQIRDAALLHDIGKIGVSDAILHKPGALTPEEWEAMRYHPVLGEEIVQKAGMHKRVLQMVRSHHERCDRKGYPDGVNIRDLWVGTRILGVADAYDAMTSDRPYRSGMTQQEAMRELARGAGTQFDPDCVHALTMLIREEALGQEAAA